MSYRNVKRVSYFVVAAGLMIGLFGTLFTGGVSAIFSICRRFDYAWQSCAVISLLALPELFQYTAVAGKSPQILQPLRKRNLLHKE